MSAKWVKRGTGITQRLELVSEPSLAEITDNTDINTRIVRVHKLFERAEESSFSRQYIEAVTEAEAVLKDAYLPIVGGFYRYGFGGWRKHEFSEELMLHALIWPEERAAPEDIKASDEYFHLCDIARMYGEDSDIDFAARIVTHVEALEIFRSADKQNDLREKFAFDLGMIIQAWTLKREIEKYALAGLRSEEAMTRRREIGNKVRQDTANRWRVPARQLAQEIWSGNPSLKRSGVISQIRRRLSDRTGVKLPTSDKQIGDVIRDLQPKKVGNF